MERRVSLEGFDIWQDRIGKGKSVPLEGLDRP